MNRTDPDTIEVHDALSRRRFIRSSAAVLLGGSVLSLAQPAAADCDHSGQQLKKCSDSDTGANSDSSGCGRCGRSGNVPSSYRSSIRTQGPVEVVKVRS